MELLTADVRLARVEDISPEFLRSRGFTALLLDVDNTLVSRATGELSSSVLAWAKTMKAAGIACCLLSNNWHRTTCDYAKALDMPIVYRAMKPLPVAYVKALAKIGAHRANTVAVGDHAFTDILGARLCVIPCIQVEPLSTTDLWYTRIFRLLEKKLVDA
ncbi:MAG: YqeG family HAD IIIA-type phosphatase [Coriobacteriales bacterium]|jgi:HAD superfamily phosphatase (TIGR01668 family)|nr:YqeG family HAD IIIA-type phosphatase [Coriobacteriales bacterium]